MIERKLTEFAELRQKCKLALAEHKANVKALIDMTIESAEKYPWERVNERHEDD